MSLWSWSSVWYPCTKWFLLFFISNELNKVGIACCEGVTRCINRSSQSMSDISYQPTDQPTVIENNQPINQSIRGDCCVQLINIRNDFVWRKPLITTVSSVQFALGDIALSISNMVIKVNITHCEDCTRCVNRSINLPIVQMFTASNKAISLYRDIQLACHNTVSNYLCQSIKFGPANHIMLAILQYFLCLTHQQNNQSIHQRAFYLSSIN